MKKKILFMRDPLIKAYTIYASMFSITNDNILAWVYNHMSQIIYVQLWKLYTHSIHYLFLRSCPFIDTFNMPKSLLLSNNYNSIIDIIIDAIDKDLYVLLNVDQFYIKVSRVYERKHFFHELFFYGYDLNNRIFYAADNLQAGKYVRMEFPFDEIKDAYHNMQSKYGYETDINFLKPNNKESTQINLEQIANGIDCYLQSKPTVEYDEKCVYGLNVLWQLHYSLKNYDSFEGNVDIRPYHVLYEHKMLMRMRMEYLVKNLGLNKSDKIIKEYSELENDYLALRNMILKYNISKQDKIIESAAIKLQKNILVESDLLTAFLSVINTDRVFST